MRNIHQQKSLRAATNRLTSTDSLERLIEFQMLAWKRRNGQLESSPVIGPAGPVITITGKSGCDGAAIAGTLARELGLALFDREIVEQIAKDAKVSERVVATLDEKLRSELDDWLAGFSGKTSLSSCQYMLCLRRVLFTIASHGSAVILGRGANFLLPQDKGTLRLCLVAPLEMRERNIMRAFHLSEKSALKHIFKTERQQRLWVKKHGNADINDATRYHLVINTAQVSTDTIVHLVKEMLSQGKNK